MKPLEMNLVASVYCPGCDTFWDIPDFLLPMFSLNKRCPNCGSPIEFENINT